MSGLTDCATKMINKMKDLYYIPKNQERFTRYKYSDFEIENPTLRTRLRSIAQKIHKYFLKPNFIPNIIKSEPLIENWKPPDPL